MSKNVTDCMNISVKYKTENFAAEIRMKFYPEMMSYLIGSRICCVILSFITYSQGLQFSMDTIPDNVYCGHLYCWVDEDIADSNISSIVSLAVYDVTQSNIHVKLASLSIFDSDIYVHKTEIFVVNATGNISKSHAELTLGLKGTSYCHNASYSCELDFITFRGDAHVIRKTVSLETSMKCHEIEEQNVELRKDNVELEKDNVELRQQALSLTAELVRLQKLVSSSQTQGVCYKGVPHNNSREIFLLWNKVAALCDTETDGGGWIIIQRRTKGDVDFYKGWNDYKNGFGTPNTDFWIGNDVIHNLTSQGQTELRFDVEYQGKQYYAHYSDFTVGNESSNYRVSMGVHDGNVGYDNFKHNNGSEFSTYDRDNINKCVSYHRGAWWHLLCTYINLNGVWGAQDSTGLFFYPIVFPGSVDVSEMKVRHV